MSLFSALRKSILLPKALKSVQCSIQSLSTSRLFSTVENTQQMQPESQSKENEDDFSIVLDPKKLPIDELGRSYGTGRRKTSVARVWVQVGSGQFTVNEKPIHEYFQPMFRLHCLEPFLATETCGAFDVWCTVKGGGMTGQSGAIRLGLSRALVNFNPLLRPYLHSGTFLWLFSVGY